MSDQNPLPLFLKKLVALALILVGAVITVSAYTSGAGWGFMGGLILLAFGIFLLVAQIVLRNQFTGVLTKFSSRRSSRTLPSKGSE